MITFLFDLDGVLIDLCEFHRDVFIKMFNLYSDKPINEKFHINYLEALSTKEKLKKIKKYYPNAIFDSELIYIKKQEITIKELSKFKFTNNTYKALLWAKNNGIQIGVYTNSIRETLNLVLKQLNITELITYSLSNEDVEEPKPSSIGYIKLMKLMNAIPENTFIFEDSVYGLQAARGTGTNATIIKVVDSLDITPSFLEHCLLYKSRPTYLQENKKIALRIVIPMAGLGSRFKKDGFIIQKPFLPMISDLQLWEEVIENLLPKDNIIRNNTEVHLIVRKEQLALFRSRPNVYVHSVPELTEGSACTVLTIRKIINDDIPLVIGNSDQYLEWDSDSFYNAAFHPDYDGAISTFYHPCPDDLKWSYVSLYEDKTVQQVAEKKYLGPYATTGIYAWKKGSDYVKYAEEMILYNDRVNNEFYTAPVYNYAIKNQKRFRISNCNAFWGVGIPTDYITFINKFRPLSLEEIYKSLWCKWGSRIPHYQVDFYSDTSICAAMWSKGIFHFNQQLQLLKKSLLPWMNYAIWYELNEPNNAILHHTFFQFHTFGIQEHEKKSMLPCLEKWTDTVRNEMCKLPPYYLHIKGIAPTRTGIVLCGYPPTDYTEVRNKIRKTAPCVEPHEQNMHHITLLRWVKPLTEIEYKEILTILRVFQHTYFGLFQPSTWSTGFSTWCMKEETLDVIHTWNTLPSPWILHRGNTNGPSLVTENNPSYLINVLEKGWDVEIDIWKTSDGLFLGHDKPTHFITDNDPILINKNTWIHCKNLDAYFYFRFHPNEHLYHYFSHDKDDITVTSKNIVWSNINKNVKGGGTIQVFLTKEYELPKGVGICTDYIPE